METVKEATENGREQKILSMIDIIINASVSHRDYTHSPDGLKINLKPKSKKYLKKVINIDDVDKFVSAGTSPKLWVLRTMATNAGLTVGYTDWYYFHKTDLNK
jgi:hypothetical protein